VLDHVKFRNRDASVRFLALLRYVLLLIFFISPQVWAGFFSADAPPGDQLLKLAATGHSQSDTEARKVLTTQLRALADQLQLTANERPFEQLLPRTRIEFFKSLSQAQNPVVDYRDRILIVDGDVNLPYAVGLIVIARGNVLIDHGERNTIISGRNIEIGFDGRYSDRTSPISLIAAAGWAEVSWAASSRVYASSGIKFSHAREAKIFTPKGVDVTTGDVPVPFADAKSRPAIVKPLFSSQGATHVAQAKPQQAVPATPSLLSDRPADFRVDGTDLHAVTVYEGHFREVRVNIALSARPITLVLNSHEAVNWILTRQPYVQLKRVIVLCPCQPTVVGAGSGVPVIIGDPRQIRSISNRGANRDDYLEMQEKFEALTGQRPVTFQSESRGVAFTIDGIKNRPLPPLPASAIAKGKVILLATQGGLLEDGKVYTYCCAGASSTARASRSYNQGKWYVEARLLTREKQISPDTGTNVGLLSADSTQSDFWVSGGEYGHNYPVIGSSQHKLFSNGDIIGIALDLDKGELSYHVNGEWITGLPGAGKGIALKSGRSYVLGVSVAASSSTVPKDLYASFIKNRVDPEQLKIWAQHHDRWHVNFGEKPFKYPMPKGFKAYGI